MEWHIKFSDWIPLMPTSEALIFRHPDDNKITFAPE